MRPTDVSRTPDDVRKYLDDDVFKLYQLIWQRFVASQMLPAVFDQTTIDITAGDYTFRATGSVQKFDGYLRVYQIPAANADRDDDEKEDEGEGKALPRVSEGQTLRLDEDSARPAFHRAAAALHGSDARERSRRKGHRAAVHVRLDHLHDRRARIREQAPRPLYAHNAWRARQRSPGEEFRRRLRRHFHRPARRRARRNRGRQVAVARSREGILEQIHHRSRSRRR